MKCVKPVKREISLCNITNPGPTLENTASSLLRTTGREIIVEVLKFMHINCRKDNGLWKHYGLSNIKFLHLFEAHHWAWLQ
jgi:hypothetical protein